MRGILSRVHAELQCDALSVRQKVPGPFLLATAVQNDHKQDQGLDKESISGRDWVLHQPQGLIQEAYASWSEFEKERARPADDGEEGFQVGIPHYAEQPLFGEHKRMGGMEMVVKGIETSLSESRHRDLGRGTSGLGVSQGQLVVRAEANGGTE